MIHTALDIRPSYEPKSYAEIVAEAAARKKRLFSPRCATQKLSEAKPKPRLIWVQKAPDERPLWQREEIRFDAHEEFFPAWRKNRAVAYVMAHSKRLGWTMEEMTGRSQIGPLVNDRQALMVEVWQIFRLTLPQIGKIFGGRDNSTVTHALRKHGIKSVQKPPIVTMGKEIDRLWRSGMLQRVIAKKIGYSQVAVQKYLASQPWYSKGGNRRLARDFDQQIREMAANGMSFDEMSRQIGLKRDSIWSYCKANGIIKTAIRHPIAEHIDTIKAMLREGKTHLEISRAIGFDRRATSRFVQKEGLNQ